MKQLSSAAFRRNYAHERDVVEVTAYGKVIGWWTPYGSAPTPQSGQPDSEAAPARMSIRPALRPHPNMVGTTQRVLDPMDLRKLEREEEATRAERPRIRL